MSLCGSCFSTLRKSGSSADLNCLFTFLKIGFDKFLVWFLEIAILAVFYFVDLLSDIASIRGFWEAETFQYMTLNIAVIFAAVLWVAVSLCREGRFIGLLGGCFLGLLGACQVLHLVVSSLALVRTVISPTVEDVRDMCRSAAPLLLTASLAEALLQSLLSSIVQAYALLHETWPSSQKSTLHLSILISVLSLANAFSEFHKKDRALQIVGIQKKELVQGRTPQVTRKVCVSGVGWLDTVCSLIVNVSPSGCGCFQPSHHLQTGIRVLRVRLHCPRAQCRGLGVLFPSVPGGDARTVSNSWSGLRRSADVVCRLRHPAGTHPARH